MSTSDWLSSLALALLGGAVLVVAVVIVRIVRYSRRHRRLANRRFRRRYRAANPTALVAYRPRPTGTNRNCASPALSSAHRRAA